MKKKNRGRVAAKKTKKAASRPSGTENKTRGFSRARIFATPTWQQEDLLWEFVEQYPDALIPPDFDE